MRRHTVLFASDNAAEYLALHETFKRKNLPYDLVQAGETEQYDIVITDYAFEGGQFVEGLLMWPRPFVLLVSFDEVERLDETLKDELSSYVVRDDSLRHIELITVVVKKLQNHEESLSRQNLFLKRSEEGYHTLVQAIPDIVYSLDPQGHFTFVNESVRSMGYEPRELIGRHFSEILHPEDLPRVSRASVLPTLKGKTTGDAGAPKLFDERRRGERRTKNLELRLRPKTGSTGREDTPSSPSIDSEVIGSLTAFGELNAVGFYPQENDEEEFLGSVGIIRDISERKRILRQKDMAQREKEQLVREVPHRVKSNLQLIASLLNLQRDAYGEEYIDVFSASHSRIIAMALVFDQMYRSQSGEGIAIQPYLEALTGSLYETYHVTSTDIRLVVDAAEIHLDLDTVTALGLIVTELVSNSLRHGFRERPKGLVRVILTRTVPRKLNLEVSDDGVGLSENVDIDRQYKGFGLELVDILVQQLEGKMVRENEVGTKYRLVFEVDDEEGGI